MAWPGERLVLAEIKNEMSVDAPDHPLTGANFLFQPSPPAQLETASRYILWGVWTDWWYWIKA